MVFRLDIGHYVKAKCIYEMEVTGGKFSYIRPNIINRMNILMANNLLTLYDHQLFEFLLGTICNSVGNEASCR